MENKEISIEKMLLEMIFKMQKLEEKVTELENTVKEMKESERNQTITGPSCEAPNQKRNTNFTQAVRDYISEQKTSAKEKGLKELVLLCNDIQKAFNVANVTRSVCIAMYDCMSEGDVVLSAPPSGYSTTVRIKYFIK